MLSWFFNLTLQFYSNDLTNDSKNQKEPENENEEEVLQFTNMRSSVHDTEEFIVSVQKAKNLDRIPAEVAVRRNVVDYEELMNEDREHHLFNSTAPKEFQGFANNNHKQLQSSANVLSSGDNMKGIFDKSDDINKLMNDLHSENDEMPQKPLI